MSANESSQASGRVPESTVREVQSHMTSISHDVIATASSRCKGYARSLRHHEQYIREAKYKQSGEQALQDMYEKHQEIYVHMEELDGMDGISGLITNGTLNQKLLQCESAGQWNDALAYYERVLENYPSNVDDYAGLYRCHENLGQFSKRHLCI